MLDQDNWKQQRALKAARAAYARDHRRKVRECVEAFAATHLRDNQSEAIKAN